MVTELRGMTWDHPRGLDSLVESNELLKSSLDISITWDARSLLAFGDQHISEFYKDYDLMVIDHPHVPDAVHAGAVVEFERTASIAQLDELSRTSVGQSHDSYLYQGRHWALAIDTAAQVSAFRPDMTDSAPVFWSDVFELAREKKVLWPYKPVDAFSTFATLMAQKGASLCTNDEFLNTEAAFEVLTFMCELAALVPDFCAKSNPIDIAEILSTSDDYAHGICMYGYSNYSHAGFRKNRLTYDDLPSFDGKATGSQLGGAGIAVSTASQHIEKAAQAAILLALPHIQATTYGLSGGQPGNLVAWKNNGLNKATNNFFRNTLRTLEGAWVRPRVLGWPDVQFESSQIIYKALLSRSVNHAIVSEIASMYEKNVKE
jgi:multiple sugar transport system substrate-binding protein